MNRVQAPAALRTVVVIALLTCGAAIGAGADHIAFAQQGIKRTILLRTDEPGSTTHEAVMGVAEIAPGTTVGRHRHRASRSVMSSKAR